jgi:hypothetical protein
MKDFMRDKEAEVNALEKLYKETKLEEENNMKR